jgi:hypothetical protein
VVEQAAGSCFLVTIMIMIILLPVSHLLQQVLALLGVCEVSGTTLAEDAGDPGGNSAVRPGNHGIGNARQMQWYV